MTTTLRDLADTPSLGLVALFEIDPAREIRWVQVTELVDASPYLVGGELVLSAGVWRRHEGDARRFVAALRERDVAAIGFGLLDRGQDEGQSGDGRVPDDVVEACRELGMPLFLVPVRTPFVAVSQWFVERLADEREDALRRAVAANAALLAAAEAPAVGDALSGVANLLRRNLGHEVWIIDETGREIARAGRRPDLGTRQALSRSPSRVVGWTVQEVLAQGRTRAVVAVACEPLGIEARGLLAAAGPVIGLVLARERAVRETERRLAGEVVSLVLGRQIDSARVRMPYYRLDPDGPLVALACVVEDPEGTVTWAEQWWDRTGRPGVAEVRDQELLVVLSGYGLAAEGRLEEVAESLAAAVSASSTGVGALAESVTTLRRSLVQARQAASLGARRAGGVVVSYGRTGDHSLLLALQDPDVVDAFRESLLGPLEEHDHRNQTRLVDTLRAFLSNGGRWQETADLLHLHVNSLRNRISRIEQLTGRELDSTPDRVDLWLALSASHEYGV